MGASDLLVKHFLSDTKLASTFRTAKDNLRLRICSSWRGRFWGRWLRSCGIAQLVRDRDNLIAGGAFYDRACLFGLNLKRLCASWALQNVIHGRFRNEQPEDDRGLAKINFQFLQTGNPNLPLERVISSYRS